MKCSRSATTFLALLLATVAADATDLPAQACLGAPRRGGLAYEYGSLANGYTHGVNGATAKRRVAFGLGYRYSELSEEATAHEVLARFSVLLNARRLLVCPVIGLGVQRGDWDAGDDGTLTTTTLSGRGGVGLGIEQRVYRDLSVIPFVVAQYVYSASYFQLEAADSEVDEAGSSLSDGDIEFGVLGRYRFLYLGFAANLSMKGDMGRAYIARGILGVTFTGTGGPRPRE